MLAAGDVAIGALSVDTLRLCAEGSPQLTAWAACFAGQLANLTDPGRLNDTVRNVEEAGNALATLDDHAGAAKAHGVRAQALARLGRIAECEAALDKALAAARQAGDLRRANGVLAGAPLAALWGPSPVARASGKCLDVVRVLRITSGSPAVEATALRCQAVLEALRGRDDAARRMLAAARASLEELGLRTGLLEADLFAGLVDLLANDPIGAEAHLRRAHAGFRELGVGVDAAQTAALLARALLAQGRDAEAEALTIESENLGGEDLKTAIAWRATRAEALARRGELNEALLLARNAVRLAEPTDLVIDHADARAALASVLSLAGRSDEADAESDRAADLYERKGASAASGALAAPSRTIDGDAATPPPTVLVPNNAAAEVYEREIAASQARRWDEVSDLLAPDGTKEDRRSGLRTTTVGSAGKLEELKFITSIPFDVSTELLATRGDRACLHRVRWSGDHPRSGRFDIGALDLHALNLDGRIATTIRFDPDDFRRGLRCIG